MAPVVAITTQRVYDGLPELYRTADIDAPGDFPLLRYLSLVADQGGDVEILADRIDFVSVPDGGEVGDTSDLVDPATADADWLPWLGQLVGLGRSIAAQLPDAQRAAIASASGGWAAGTKASIAAAAATALTGTQYVLVRDHYGGDPWVLELHTRASETPDAGAVIDAVLAANAKPAGYSLVVTSYEATWDYLEANLPTWADWETDTWIELEEEGAP